eukprot:scaffold287_cov337-Pavlova_lutheri.AAC.95
MGSPLFYFGARQMRSPLDYGNAGKRQAKMWGFYFKMAMTCIPEYNDKHAHSFDRQFRSGVVSYDLL